MRTAGTILILFTLCHLSLSETIVVTKTWNITSTQLKVFEGGLIKYFFDNYLYHWGPINEQLIWDSQGFIDQEQLDTAAGTYENGLQMTEDKDNKYYLGVHLREVLWPTVIVIPKGVMLYNRFWALLCFGKIPNFEEEAALGKISTFIDELYNSYRIIYSAKLSQLVMAGPRAPDKYKISLDNIDNATDYRSLYLSSSPPKFMSDKNWVGTQKSWALIDHLQPIGAKCARIMHPDDPTKSVDGNFLEKYVEAVRRATRHISVSKKDSRTTANMTSPALVDIWGSLSTDKEMFRARELRYGNPENSYTVLLSLAQVQLVKTNPFLTVKFGKSAGNLTEAQISHPDSLSPEKFLKFLSSDVRRTVTSYSKDEISKNITLRENLTQMIVTDLFWRVVDNISTDTFPTHQQIVDLASISPFADYNDDVISILVKLWSSSFDVNGINFPPSLTPFIVGNSKNSSLYKFSVRERVQVPQWRQFLDHTFGGPQMRPTYENWNLLDADYSEIFSDWKNNYDETECESLVMGDWFGFMDKRTKKWRG